MSEAPSPLDHAIARQRDRLAQVPVVYKTNLERMACELALKTAPADEIFTAYGYDANAALALLDSKQFKDILSRVEQEVATNALSIRAKARAMVEDLLPDAYQMASDPVLGAATRLDVMQWLGRLADVEPKKDSKDAGAGGGLVLNIQFTGAQAEKVVVNEPVTIEAGK